MVKELSALHMALSRLGSPKPQCLTSFVACALVGFPLAGRNIRFIASVHCAECTIKPRILSGHKLGYLAINWAAILAQSAEAALVALLVENCRSAGFECVVSKLKLGIQTALRPSCAALPPSNTTSGFNGQCACQVCDVVLKGLKPPTSAIGL